ncbi:GtrA family protein [Xenorhabdus budapestensis]|uniref:Bactoprenol-linked glucose translocase n=1 Tax=Xenorhabdus budapestensis TaxID=290110 RepID=A0ABX7VGA4_XENBU|nr:GtrA family protein [Xenorhabdus budapestensis]QTL39806.1 GtrA family protein [Xenorhabdus budapestensis]
MLALFTKYLSIGVINTAIHWVLFTAVLHFFGASQAISNLVGFLAAVTFSFYANAKITFQKKATGWRYSAFISFMGLMSYMTGSLADAMDMQPIVTLVSFSATSLILGFMYSKFLIFRGKE